MYRISFSRRSVTEVNTPRGMTSRSIFENQSSTWFPRRVCRRVVEPDVRMCDEKGADLLRLMSGEFVVDDVDFASPRLRLDDDLRKAAHSSLVWRGTALPSTSPVWVLSAAYGNNVPCR